MSRVRVYVIRMRKFLCQIICAQKKRTSFLACTMDHMIIKRERHFYYQGALYKLNKNHFRNGGTVYNIYMRLYRYACVGVYYK